MLHIVMTAFIEEGEYYIEATSEGDELVEVEVIDLVTEEDAPDHVYEKAYEIVGDLLVRLADVEPETIH